MNSKEKRWMGATLALGILAWGAHGCSNAVSGRGTGDDDEGMGGDPGDGGEDSGGDGDGDTGSGGGEADGTGGAAEGGGPNVPDSSTSASGSRLKRRYLDAGGGARMVFDFWDTELEVACSFAEGVDDTTRCLIDSYLIGEAIFSDATCNDHVYADDYLCDSGWARANASGALYRKTDTPTTLPDGYFVETYNGDCQATGLSTEGDFYEMELVPSSSFVPGQYTEEARDDGMVARYIEGEEGSRLLVETVFEARGYRCAFNDAGYCLPSDDIYRDLAYFEDAGCTEGVYGFRDRIPPMIELKATSAYCSDLEYFERGEELTTGGMYRIDNNDECIEVTPDYANYNFYKPGERVMVSSLPRAKRELLGEGELVARRWVDDSGEPLSEVDDFWDTTRDESCIPFAAAGGGYACVPTNYARVDENYHQDSGCADVDQRAEAICPPETPRVAARFGARSCEIANLFTLEAAYEVGAPLGQEYYFENDYVDCEMRTMFEFYSAYATGEDLLSTIKALELVVDD